MEEEWGRRRERKMRGGLGRFDGKKVKGSIVKKEEEDKWR